MVALYQISTNTIIQNYGGGIPNVLEIPGLGNVHDPSSNWSWGDYEFIPVIYTGTPNYPGWSISTGTVEQLQIANGQPQLVITTVYQDPPLVNVQSQLCDSIDNQAEEIRGLYVPTSAPGQLVVYLLRLMEAQAIAKDPDPNPSNYPITAASLGLPGIGNNLANAVQTTTTLYQEWITMAAQIENIRLGTKDAINAANSISAAIAIANAVSWGSLNE